MSEIIYKPVLNADVWNPELSWCQDNLLNVVIVFWLPFQIVVVPLLSNFDKLIKN